jgi:hypothetical protein
LSPRARIADFDLAVCRSACSGAGIEVDAMKEALGKITAACRDTSQFEHHYEPQAGLASIERLRALYPTRLES